MRWTSDFNVRFEIANEILGSDFDFAQLSGEAKFQFGTGRRNNVVLRLFGGYSMGGDSPPVQELFYADGGGPLDRFGQFFLRSTGAFPAELHYHFPGDGNLRGYFNQHDNLRLASERLVAINLKVTKGLRIPLLNRLFTAMRMNTAISGFFDMGHVYDMAENGSIHLMDAGLGLKLLGRLPVTYRSCTLRFDFPFWLSESSPGENNLKFRWLFSFSQAL